MGVVGEEPKIDATENFDAGVIDKLALDNLMTFGPGGKLVPDLATSMNQTSSVTYVYHLRHGVKFWDGAEMTSADVVYSLDYWNKPGSQVGFSTSIKTIKADGHYTVVVTLGHPDASFPYVPAGGDGAPAFLR